MRACVAHACAEKDSHPDEGLQAVRDLARSLRGSIDKGGGDRGDADSWPSSWKFLFHGTFPYLVGKTLFVLKSGFIALSGLGVGEMQDGDLVVIPPWVGTVMVLRRASCTVQQSRKTVYTYTMAGCAYLHGVMHDETEGQSWAGTLERYSGREYLVR